MSFENAIDRSAVRAHFRRAAATCGEDVLTREVDRRMQERLDYVRLQPRCILDLGCGPNPACTGLAARYPQAHCVGLDPIFAQGRAALASSGYPSPTSERGAIASESGTTDLPSPCHSREGGNPAPDKRAGGEGIQAPKPQQDPRITTLAGDAEALPLRENCADLVWANLLLPWLVSTPAFLAEALRCLTPGGLLMFSALGPDTLKELRGGFRDGYAHTQTFPDLHDLGDLLLSSGFADPVVDMEIITLTYTHLEGLIRDLRAAGATCAMQGRRRGLVGRQVLKNLHAHYETLRREERLPATFEILYGHAWKPEHAPSEHLPDGRAVIRFR